jgi:spore coat protein U-like protein
MKHWACKLVVLSASLSAGAANAAVTCSMSVTNTYPIYDPTAHVNTDATGSVTLNCTRTAGETSTPYWIGADNGLSGARTLTRQTGTQTLTYNLYTNSNHTSNWTMANGLSGTLTFSGPVASTTLSYYFRIPRSNTSQPAGLYDDSILVTQRFISSGDDISTATLTPVASIVAECRVSSTPAPLVLNYSSFSASAVTASTSFGVSCTNSTPYAMALDATSGTLLGLQYSLALSASSGTGNALPQTYSVTGTMAANQSGTCATGSCNGTEARTITITY